MTIILILIFGITALILIFLVIKNLLAPKKVENVRKLLKQGKTQQAIKLAKAIIVKESKNPEAHYLLGLALYQENKFELALMEFKIVSTTALFGREIPEIDFRKTISQLYLRFNQYEEALKEYLLLLRLEPNNHENFFQTGKLFELRGKYDAAAGYYRKTIELNSRHAGAHSALGGIMYRTKQIAEAKTEFEAAIRIEPNNAEAYYYLGKLHKENREYAAALAAFEKALRSPEFKQKALIERGGCYLSANNIEKATIELERAVKNIQDDNEQESLYARYFLSVCYEKTRNLDKAIEQLEKIHARKPSFRDVAEKLAQYQELRTNDNIKEFLTCGKDDFLYMCTAIVQDAFELKVQRQAEIKNGCEIVAVEGDSEKWRNMRKQPRLIRFYRMTDPIEETLLRNLQDEMKKQNFTRGIILTSSSFTRSSIDYAESRPLELFNKEQLDELMAKSNLYRK